MCKGWPEKHALWFVLMVTFFQYLSIQIKKDPGRILLIKRLLFVDCCLRSKDTFYMSVVFLVSDMLIELFNCVHCKGTLNVSGSTQTHILILTHKSPLHCVNNARNLQKSHCVNKGSFSLLQCLFLSIVLIPHFYSASKINIISVLSHLRTWSCLQPEHFLAPPDERIV